MEEQKAALEKLHIYAVRHNQSQPGEAGLRLLIVQSGEATLQHPSWTQTLSAGTLMLLGPEVTVLSKRGEFTELQFGLPDAAAQETLRNELSLLSLDGEALRRTNALLSFCFICNDADSVRHLVIVLLREILSAPRETEVQPPKLRAILRWLEDHYMEDCGVRQLSERFHYNSVYLSRLFRQNLHCTINDYVRRLRLQKATELLVNTDEPIARIAEQTGHPNMQHFFRHFKEDYGMTPKTYRMNYSKGVEKQ